MIVMRMGNEIMQQQERVSTQQKQRQYVAIGFHGYKGSEKRAAFKTQNLLVHDQFSFFPLSPRPSERGFELCPAKYSNIQPEAGQ